MTWSSRLKWICSAKSVALVVSDFAERRSRSLPKLILLSIRCISTVNLVTRDMCGLGEMHAPSELGRKPATAAQLILTVAPGCWGQHIIARNNIRGYQDVDDKVEQDAGDEHNLEAKKLPPQLKPPQRILEGLLSQDQAIHSPEGGEQVQGCHVDVGIVSSNLRLMKTSHNYINEFIRQGTKGTLTVLVFICVFFKNWHHLKAARPDCT